MTDYTLFWQLDTNCEELYAEKDGARRLIAAFFLDGSEINKDYVESLVLFSGTEFEELGNDQPLIFTPIKDPSYYKSFNMP